MVVSMINKTGWMKAIAKCSNEGMSQAEMLEWLREGLIVSVAAEGLLDLEQEIDGMYLREDYANRITGKLTAIKRELGSVTTTSRVMIDGLRSKGGDQPFVSGDRVEVMADMMDSLRWYSDEESGVRVPWSYVGMYGTVLGMKDDLLYRVNFDTPAMPVGVDRVALFTAKELKHVNE